MPQDQPTNNDQMKIKFRQNPAPKAQTMIPGGMILISTYEILLGVFLVFSGIFIILYANSSSVQSNTALAGTSSSEFLVLGVIIILWGILGIAGAILFLKWKNIGYALTLLFLISTGLILFAFYFIPLVSMIISLIYFIFNKRFKDTFNAMKR